MSSIVLAFFGACIVSLVIVPVAKRACARFDLTDCPDAYRKLHRHPVAVGGGVVAYLATVGVSLPLLLLRDDTTRSLRASGNDLTGMLIAGTIIVLVGIADDGVGLRGRHKLLGQLIACSVLPLFGLIIRRLQFFGWTVELGPLSVPVTLIWLLAAVNAINLLDGINGLAAIIGIIDCLAIAILAHRGGHDAAALVAASFAGSLFGFLRYNFPQAKMFLGDAGSMLIGLLIGGLTLQTCLKGPGTVLLGTPLCLMAIPLFDSAAAVLRRKLTGRSIFSGDRAHLHHRLTERYGSLRAVAIVALGSGLTAAAALASIVWRNEFVAVVSGTAIILVFVVSRMFGHSELLLLSSRVNSFARSFLHLNRRLRGPDTHSTVHLQGSHEWKLIWADLTDAARDLPVNTIELDVNAPMIQEGFHATWTHQPAQPPSDLDNIWRFKLPLVAGGHQIGQIRVSGERSPNLPPGALERVLILLESFESELEALFPPLSTVEPVELVNPHVVAGGAESP
jgi:UDP-GlcNAc:undecaprenyl-phosphate GlcNAc-1-phosphate transferase